MVSGYSECHHCYPELLQGHGCKRKGTKNSVHSSCHMGSKNHTKVLLWMAGQEKGMLMNLHIV